MTNAHRLHIKTHNTRKQGITCHEISEQCIPWQVSVSVQHHQMTSGVLHLSKGSIRRDNCCHFSLVELFSTGRIGCLLLNFNVSMYFDLIFYDNPSFLWSPPIIYGSGC